MADETAVQAPAVEDLDGITVIRGSQSVRSWNNINYALGMSAKNVGTEGLSVNLATVPPGGVAYAHIHDGFEVILYIMQGENEAGDFIYIKPGVPHEVYNISDSEPVVALVSRSAADEWDRIIPYERP
jgi:uncharacterized RmlC-like cupin family protein